MTKYFCCDMIVIGNTILRILGGIIMCWVIICPACEKRLLLTDREDRDPELGLVIDDYFFGACGVDMRITLKQYADELRKLRTENGTK